MLADSRLYRNDRRLLVGSDRPAPPDSRSRWLLLAGFLAPVLFLAASLVEGLLRPGYSILRDYVSDLSLGPDGWMQNATFIACGWMLLGFAFALCRLAESGIAPGWSPVLFASMGVGLIGCGAFEIDPVWGRLTVHGELHYAFSAVIAGSLAVSALLAWRDVRREGRPRAAAAYLGAGLICVGLFAASLLLPPADLPGLLERVALLVGALWISAFALALLERGQEAVCARCQLGTTQPSRNELERKGLAA